MTRSDPASVPTGTVRIAVDLLGGDQAPAVVVDGALRACGTDPDLHLRLVGPTSVADRVIAACPPADRWRLTVTPVGSAVAMTDAPSKAARHDTTVRAAVSEITAGRVDALVSAGASGAVVTAVVLGLGREEGVTRPALAAVVPAGAGPVVLLDVGASPDASATVLIQYARLGSAYASRILGMPRPRVGLLSIGEEPGKGDRVRRAVDEALRAGHDGDLDYVGNVEGHDVPLGGRADVIVTDGFTGNVLLKGIEGAMELAGWPPTVPVAARAAVLLGVQGRAVVCHGAASGADVASGIALAATLCRTGTATGAGTSTELAVSPAPQEGGGS